MFNNNYPPRVPIGKFPVNVVVSKEVGLTLLGDSIYEQYFEELVKTDLN